MIGQAGSLAYGWLTAAATTLGKLVIGAGSGSVGVLANALVDMFIYKYGENELRANGAGASPPYDASGIPDLLLDWLQQSAVRCGDVPLYACNVTPIGNGWMDWATASEKTAAQLALVAYNERLADEYATYGAAGVIDLCSLAALKSLGNEEGDPAYPGSDTVSWDAWPTLDSIHHLDNLSAAEGHKIRQFVWDRLTLPSTGSGSGGGSTAGDYMFTVTTATKAPIPLNPNTVVKIGSAGEKISVQFSNGRAAVKYVAAGAPPPLKDGWGTTYQDGTIFERALQGVDCYAIGVDGNMHAQVNK